MACPYCSTSTKRVYHRDRCPKLKQVSYYPDGEVKQVKLFQFREVEAWQDNDVVIQSQSELEAISKEVNERINIIGQFLEAASAR